MPYKIMTHDGKAHMDELLGASLLALYLGEEPESIERIDSQTAEAIVRDGAFSEDTYFIDCGMVFDPDRRLYDHHQDRGQDSAALLIFNQFFSHLKGTELHRYMELVSKVDTKSAMSLDDFDVLSESRDYLTFSQGIILKAFADEPLLILRIFMVGLDDKIRFEQAKSEAVLWLEEAGNIEIRKLGELNVLRYMVKPPSELVSPLRSAISSIVDENNVAAILSFDDKVEGAETFYRTDYGHDLIDFSRCEPANEIFKHPGGFLMKFIPSDNEEWIELIKAASEGIDI